MNMVRLRTDLLLLLTVHGFAKKPNLENKSSINNKIQIKMKSLISALKRLFCKTDVSGSCKHEYWRAGIRHGIAVYKCNKCNTYLNNYR